GAPEVQHARVPGLGAEERGDPAVDAPQRRRELPGERPERKDERHREKREKEVPPEEERLHSAARASPRSATEPRRTEVSARREALSSIESQGWSSHGWLKKLRTTMSAAPNVRAAATSKRRAEEERRARAAAAVPRRSV